MCFRFALFVLLGASVTKALPSHLSEHLSSPSLTKAVPPHVSEHLGSSVSEASSPHLNEHLAAPVAQAAPLHLSEHLEASVAKGLPLHLSEPLGASVTNKTLTALASKDSNASSTRSATTPTSTLTTLLSKNLNASVTTPTSTVPPYHHLEGLEIFSAAVVAEKKYTSELLERSNFKQIFNDFLQNLENVARTSSKDNKEKLQEFKKSLLKLNEEIHKDLEEFREQLQLRLSDAERYSQDKYEEVREQVKSAFEKKVKEGHKIISDHLQKVLSFLNSIKDQ
ncbi:hypothetical protein QAD02_006997 [Eretmocerus hayati]|uniref:Uncharacterized protein n=1 Tax=Eretmocerus hayati TaxID=131215 RepID=A0ACC2N2D2_9HYME|nr:hypothetical protein QAD02_006997 [Eretmocerus hayati]